MPPCLGNFAFCDLKMLNFRPFLKSKCVSIQNDGGGVLHARLPKKIAFGELKKLFPCLF